VHVTIRFDVKTPSIIAHRGASGYFPEHTREGYRRAMELGADYIEPDLVLTKDGHLIARHDAYLSSTTDVADHPEFAGRKRYLDFIGREDWLTSDFTLDEIRTLRARQPFPGRDTSHDDLYLVPTFAEVIDIAKEGCRVHGRPIGVYPETKHPAMFEAMGFDFATLLLTILFDADAASGQLPVVIQSFEPHILENLRSRTELPLIYLLEEMDIPKAKSMISDAAAFIDGIGPYKEMLWNPDAGDTGLMAHAHDLGLMVHAYTFRDDAIGRGFSDKDAEYRHYFDMGLDGMFTDFTDTGVRIRDEFLADQAD